ncbi:ethanolamine ammonia-lyase subunit EutC [Cellulosilyticum sp. I15G10I2]|uniref:ethanolamine ammonia-lyase subunit EutC n=1 Tax=Cellulosilyticum sp. I15G10I2 TaxID=1892843 RepID=UPI00085C8EBB|nr:ethanolamine ammonia-lyase subunit EutC [Cellulosilyticum sp. I15G10I2]
MDIGVITPARIHIGRSGARMTTKELLKFRQDHAIAMDAVWSHADEELVKSLGFKVVNTLINDKEEYIRRPDLGRRFSEETLEDIKSTCIHQPAVQIIAADGLSSPAIDANLKDIYGILTDGFKHRGITVGTPIFVRYGRVATMDYISEAVGAEVTILLVGERPGLATGESMSAYMAYQSSASKPESQRTVVSNIHSGGLYPVEAGAQIIHIAEIMLKEKKSGVDLKI